MAIDQDDDQEDDLSEGGFTDFMAGKAAIWGPIALVTAFVVCYLNNAPMVVMASFWMKCLAVVLGTILGACGALIGEAIRQFARPNFIMTRGGVLSLLWLRVFWSIGPQVVGLFVGTILGIVLVLQ